MDLKKTLLLVGLSSGLAHADAHAAVESALTASYGSEYIYRGVNVGDDHVSLNLTASGEAAGLTWNAGLLHGSTETSDETRMMLGVSKSLSDSLSVNVGMMNTSLLAAGDLREVYVGVSTALAGIDLSGTVFFNQNDALATDSYYELSASYHHCMGDGLGATLAVSYGNWDEDPGGTLEDVDALAISVTLNKDLGGGLEGSLGVTHSISDTAISEDETVVGASVTFSF